MTKQINYHKEAFASRCSKDLRCRSLSVRRNLSYFKLENRDCSGFREKGIRKQRVIIANSFSINMLKGPGLVKFTQITAEKAGKMLQNQVDFVPAVGHRDTATIIDNLLCLPEERSCGNRLTLTVEKGDLLIVGQYTGPRLPEGAKSLPEGARILFWAVEV